MGLRNIKLVISEADGVITEHLVGYGELNTVVLKQFYMKDFEAINLMKKYWNFAFMSSDASITASMCRKRNVSFYFAERNKKETYNSMLRRYDVTADDVLYIGSSYSDIDCFKMSGFSICPEDAVPQIKNLADHVLPVYGGAGVLCYIYEMLNNLRLNKNRED